MVKLVGIDSVLFIYIFEKDHALAKKAKLILKNIEVGNLNGIFSSIGLIEVLTGPKKMGNQNLAFQYKTLISNIPNLTIIGINESIVELASDLRAKYGIKTPDAIHIATAIDAKADKFITNDKKLKKIKEIKIELL